MSGVLGLVARRLPPGARVLLTPSVGGSATAPTAAGAAASIHAPGLLLLLDRRYSSSSSSSRRRVRFGAAAAVSPSDALGSSCGDLLLLQRRRDRQRMRPMQLGGRRGLATGPGGGRIVEVVARESTTTNAANAAGDAASAMASSSSSSSLLDGTLSSKLLALSGAAEGQAAAAVETLGNWPSDWAIRGIELLHETTGLPYWVTIITLTLAMRTALFPLVIMTARNAAKMTLMRPEMDAITESAKAAPMGDRAAQQRYQKEMWGLFDKYQCSPLRSFVGPLANIALFVPMFFGLQKMGKLGVPGFDQGGAEWFLDLGAADPTYILPACVTLGFLAVTEVGMDGIQMQMSPQMKFVFRILPVALLPMTATMPTGCLLYWGSSNLFSLGQSLLLRNQAVKRHFGIPNIPQKMQQQTAAQANPFKQLLDRYEETKKNKAIADAEILHGGRRPPPPPPAPGASSTFAKHPGLRATPPKKR